MTKNPLLAVALCAGLSSLLPQPAQAGLIGAGRTVQALFYTGQFALPEAERDQATNSNLPSSLAAPVNYLAGTASGTTILVGDTQITLTNQPSQAPFCLSNQAGMACPDVIQGFDFLFTGENILGVTVSPASAPAFLPVTGTFQGNTHLGLQLLSPNEIRVDVTGDVPLLLDQLILDLVFAVTPPASVPEPRTLALLSVGLFGLSFARRCTASSAWKV